MPIGVSQVEPLAMGRTVLEAELVCVCVLSGRCTARASAPASIPGLLTLPGVWFLDASLAAPAGIHAF